MKIQSKMTSDAVEILHQRFYSGNPRRLGSLEEARSNAEIARKIFDLRAQARLTQRKLAKMVGTSPAVISRLEDADYRGHSLGMLRRIAAALNMRLELRFVAVKKKLRRA